MSVFPTLARRYLSHPTVLPALLLRRMATLQVRLGLNAERKLPDTQVVLVGRKSLLKGLELSDELAAKFGSLVGKELFGQAIAQIESAGGSVPIYLDLAKIVSVPDELSRYNTPSNGYSITKEVKAIKSIKGVKKLSIVLYSDYANMMASCVAVARAFPLFSQKTKNNGLESVEIELVPVKSSEQPTEKEVNFLQTLCSNVRECCRLVDTPASILHSEAFLDEALSMIDQLEEPIEKTIIKGEELKEKGFGGLYSVGQAAAHPPIFACFSHKPEGAENSYALVGKGIVYDTGGLSLKGRTAMPTMKIDMGGAASVLSAFCTLVKMGFNQNLHCLLCIAENHISPTATRPDDIITMLSGKTVEVNNTDAEGRLVLADGVFYAKEALQVQTIIDMATLTGAQAFATGKFHAAILSSSEQLEADCVVAGRHSGDLVHPLPFVPELHFADLNSKVADMKNACLSGSSGPPTAVAGLFIGKHIEFGGKGAEGGDENGKEGEALKQKNVADWLHIDMAELTSVEKWDGRATGYGVSLLCSLLAKHTDVNIAKCGT